MAASIINTADFKRKTEKERAEKVLLKARNTEKRLIEDGWRYVKVDERRTVLIPCDKEGNPTKQGQKTIEKLTKC